MSTTETKEQFVFQAEISRLLHLLSESLYQNREIAIRELVSNASDAIDKRRHVSLTDSDVKADDLQVTLLPNKEDRTLIIRDNGIGMTRDELVANLGTIAHSGSLDYLTKLQKSDKEDDVNLIGQFGVGFYSSFMLAERVEVKTRSVSEDKGWIWESTGDGNFSIAEPAEPLEIGSEVVLHLKKDLDEYTDPTRLKFILKKYSTFVPYPIKVDDEHVNDQPPIWVEPKSSVSEEQYQNFYEYLTQYPGQKALWHLHLTADSPFQFHSILYCPDANLERMGFGKMEHGLHLCAKRILVQNDNRDLLPDYLRFLRGIVDSADLPLNVSREALQDNTVFRKMKKVITKKVLDNLDSVAADDAEAYGKFYKEFGSVLREGIGEDFDNKDRLAKLLRFQSTKTAGEGYVSLAEYCERASEDQKQIYYAMGGDAAAVLRDPNMEIFKQKELEVIVLTDPVDEYVLSNIREFEGRDLVPIDSADLKLPGAEEKEEDDSSDEKAEDKKDDSADLPAGFNTVLTVMKAALGDQVEAVRKSERLTESACCLVNSKGAQSTAMQKVLQSNMPDFEMSTMIMELNPNAPLVKRLCDLAVNDDNKPFIEECGRQLHANAMVMAGLAPNGQDMANRVQDFMLQLAETKSSIVQ